MHAMNCTEPEGNHEVDGQTAHDICLDAMGACPWCGFEEPTYNTALDPISPAFDLRLFSSNGGRA